MRRFTNLVREGRLRSAVGSSLRLGILVEQNPGTPAEIREADGTSGAAIGGSGSVLNSNVGILWYEHDSQTYNDPAFGAAAGQLPQDLDTAPAARLVQVLSGKGVKIWLRNTALDTTEPGLNFPAERAAVTMVNNIAGLTVGDLLGWNDASTYWAATTTAAEAFMVVTDISADDTRVECTLLV
jgi:hypothetical protein